MLEGLLVACELVVLLAAFGEARSSWHCRSPRRRRRARLAAQLDGALRPSVGGAGERFPEILYDAKRAEG
jgi:hypothetical protein